MVIDDQGVNLGEMPTFEARKMAEERGLDLVEINPVSRPPVCKIMDYGKFKYEQSKRERLNRAKQKETELKEIRLTPKISDHDIAYKAKQAREFFDRGNKVKVSMRLRGRENVFTDNALKVFEKFAEQAGLVYERTPVKAGNQITAVIAKLREETATE
ncbi:MAG: Translation initiation factor IF-3 [bacterium ADurb.Bin400]|nr:MAG: Translation initiation factor IF-3 [bacterium ADurb.Bin400]